MEISRDQEDLNASTIAVVAIVKSGFVSLRGWGVKSLVLEGE